MNRPQIGLREQLGVHQVLRSGKLAQGDRVAHFERQFAEIHSCSYAVSCNSGTSALYLILLGLKIGPGDEVLVPAFTFGATANAVLMTGATVKFVDVDVNTFNMNLEDAIGKITKKTKAIMVVHLYGNPVNLDSFSEVAKAHNLFLIQDAAQAHLAKWNNRSLADYGDAVAFSFYPTKNMTTIEGGMVLTPHKELAKTMSLLRNQGMSSRYMYECPGLNLRMSEVSAAIGSAQVKKIPQWTERRIQNAQFLASKLEIPSPKADPRAKHVYHQFTLRVNSNFRDQFRTHLTNSRIECDIYYPRSLTSYSFFGSQEECENSLILAEQVISIPVHHRLLKQDLNYIATTVNRFLQGRSGAREL